MEKKRRKTLARELKSASAHPLVLVRLARQGDIQGIRDVFRKTGHYTQEIDGARGFYAVAIRDYAHPMIVAEHRHTGEIVGVLVVEVVASWACFWRIGVLRQYQRVGIGSLLMKSAEAALFAIGVRFVQLFASTSNAMAFYRALKYRKCSRRQIRMFSKALNRKRGRS